MPKYLFQGSYTQQGLAGVMKEGGSKRKQAVVQLCKGLGGKLESMHFAFGSDDFFIIADMPGNVDVTALSLMVNSTGAVKVRVNTLITPEEVDEAVTRTVKYRPPGA